jgi:hypothetical protein
MSKLLSLITLGLGLSLSAAQAQVQIQKATPQQDKTAMCEKAAGARKGGERLAFINSCLATAKSEAAQPIKMSGCDHASRAEDL